MSSSLILLVVVIYFWISIDLFRSGQVGLSIAYFSYATSNIGLWIVSK